MSPTPPASIRAHFKASIEALEVSAASFADNRIYRAIGLIVDALKASRPLLICGNGGSAADAQHIAAELVGRFLKNRRPYNAICLAADVAVLTAWGNDQGFDDVFARQVEAHGMSGGVLLVLSTSGNSTNIVRAAEAAKRVGLPVIALTGQGGGKLKALSDILLDVPSKQTPLIQQVHTCLYHYICEQVEARLD